MKVKVFANKNFEKQWNYHSDLIYSLWEIILIVPVLTMIQEQFIPHKKEHNLYELL